MSHLTFMLTLCAISCALLTSMFISYAIHQRHKCTHCRHISKYVNQNITYCYISDGAIHSTHTVETPYRNKLASAIECIHEAQHQPKYDHENPVKASSTYTCVACHMPIYRTITERSM